MRRARGSPDGLGSRERMVAVRAWPTIGFISGNGQISGRRLKPAVRRAGATSSRALQIVGVSIALRRSAKSADSIVETPETWPVDGQCAGGNWQSAEPLLPTAD